MSKKKKDKENFIDLYEVRSMLYIPQNAIELKMNIKVFENSKMIKVTKTLNLQEIQEAIKKAEEGYIDEDDKFVLTEKGRCMLKNNA